MVGLGGHSRVFNLLAVACRIPRSPLLHPSVQCSTCSHLGMPCTYKPQPCVPGCCNNSDPHACAWQLVKVSSLTSLCQAVFSHR